MTLEVRRAVIRTVLEQRDECRVADVVAWHSVVRISPPSLGQKLAMAALHVLRPRSDAVRPLTRQRCSVLAIAVDPDVLEAVRRPAQRDSVHLLEAHALVAEANDRDAGWILTGYLVEARNRVEHVLMRVERERLSREAMSVRLGDEIERLSCP